MLTHHFVTSFIPEGNPVAKRVAASTNVGRDAGLLRLTNSESLTSRENTGSTNVNMAYPTGTAAIHLQCINPCKQGCDCCHIIGWLGLKLYSDQQNKQTSSQLWPTGLMTLLVMNKAVAKAVACWTGLTILLIKSMVFC